MVLPPFHNVRARTRTRTHAYARSCHVFLLTQINSTALLVLRRLEQLEKEKQKEAAMIEANARAAELTFDFTW